MKETKCKNIISYIFYDKCEIRLICQIYNVNFNLSHRKLDIIEKNMENLVSNLVWIPPESIPNMQLNCVWAIRE